MKLIITHIGLYDLLIRAITRQMEAEREERADVIPADAEFQAPEKIFSAARVKW